MSKEHDRQTCVKALTVKLHNRRVTGRLMKDGETVWKFTRLREGEVKAVFVRLSPEAVNAMMAIAWELGIIQ